MTGERGLAGRLHDRLDLLHVVDVERADAVAAGGGLVEELAHGDERHLRDSVGDSSSVEVLASTQ